jgi:acetyltransferase-like isoleucine patch superfamily enzyme
VKNHVKKIGRIILNWIYQLLILIPFFKVFEHSQNTHHPVRMMHWFSQKILGINRGVYWPVHPASQVTGVNNIYCGIGSAPGYNLGCYIQGIGKIYIGDYTLVAANVGIISANHSLEDSRKHVISEVRIGNYCWIGMGAIILPGVNLGDYTIVAAGSVVNRSFPDGYCVLAGSPATRIKKIDREQCIHYENEHKYHGYIRAENFAKYRNKMGIVNRDVTTLLKETVNKTV